MKVDDIKCKTTYKTSFTTKMETQCTPTFDTSCSTVLQTAYKQDCKTISDVECRIVNIDKHGKYTPKVNSIATMDDCLTLSFAENLYRCSDSKVRSDPGYFI